MHGHAPNSIATTIQRHCDVAVIGGSAAGLAGALQIARQNRSVIVVDSGEPRNAAASHMHSYLGHEGLPPSELLKIAREEVRSFGGEVLAGRVVEVTRASDEADVFRFVVRLTGGAQVLARRVLVATGVRDVLPEIDALADHWGSDVVTCPFCHGYEVRDRRIVQILTHPMGLHPASLFAHLSEQFTIVIHDGVSPDDPQVLKLRAAGVNVIEGRVRRVIAEASGRLDRVELVDGTVIMADSVVVTTRAEPQMEPFAELGLHAASHPSGIAHRVETNPTFETKVAGVYAAGNVVDPSLQMLPSAAAGSQAGAMISFSLAEDDLSRSSRPSANQADWDHRYSGDQMWSGNPNGSLVAEAEGLEPGTALDVGAGEGGDAVWLAEQDWRVTANDISQNAVDRIGAVASDRGLQIDCRQGDVNGVDPFAGATFDLVSAQYASIPRSADGRGVENLLAAVAPGGTLLVVSHDLEPMRTPIDTQQTSRAFDPDAYVRVDDFADAIADRQGWEIFTHEKRSRPPGAASTHHVDDVILKARRV